MLALVFLVFLPSSLGQDYTVEQFLNAQGATFEDLKTLLGPGSDLRVTTLERDSYIFHHNHPRYFADLGLPMPSSFEDWEEYLNLRMRDFYHPPNKDLGGMVGPGLYFHQTLQGSVSYGEQLLVVRLPKGSRILTGFRLKEGPCKNMNNLGVGLSGYSSCRDLMLALLKALRIDALAYDWGWDLESSCEFNENKAFVLTDQARAQAILAKDSELRTIEGTPKNLTRYVRDLNERARAAYLQGWREGIITAFPRFKSHLIGCTEKLKWEKVKPSDLRLTTPPALTCEESEAFDALKRKVSDLSAALRSR